MPASGRQDRQAHRRKRTRPSRAHSERSEKATALAEKAADARNRSGARQEDQRRRARKAYGEGEKAYAAGDFTGALTRASPKPTSSSRPPHAMAYWAAKSLDRRPRQRRPTPSLATRRCFWPTPSSSKLGDEKLVGRRSCWPIWHALKAAQSAEVSVVTGAAGARDLAGRRHHRRGQAGPLPMTTLKLKRPARTSSTLAAEGYDAERARHPSPSRRQGRSKKASRWPHAAPPPPAAAARSGGRSACSTAAAAAPAAEKHSKVPAYVTLGIAAVLVPW